MDVDQFVALRGQMDGETLMGYFSPITRPDDEGVIANWQDPMLKVVRLQDYSRLLALVQHFIYAQWEDFGLSLSENASCSVIKK